MFKFLPTHGRVAVGLVAASLLAIVALPTGASAATPSITFSMQIYGPCLDGYSAANTNISIVWRDSTGSLKAKGSTMSTSYGSWDFCSTDETVAVMPGDKVNVSDGSYTRAYSVPNLTIQVDRVNSTYLGTGPAGRTIKLFIPNGDVERIHGVRVGANGTWSFTPAEGLGGSYVVDYIAYATWDSPNSDHLEVYAYFPKIGVTLGKADFYGTTTPFTDVSATISDGSHGQGSAMGDGRGTFSGVFRNSSGNAVSVSPGDHISAPSLASNADWIVPAIQGSADKTTEIVTGTCSDTGTAATYVGVTIVRPDGHVRAAATWATESDGSFVADFTDYGPFGPQHANIKTGDRVKIDCFQTTGDFARLTFVVR
jgi:hypothetical protein